MVEQLSSNRFRTRRESNLQTRMCDCAHSKSSLLHGRAIVNGSVHPPLPSYTDGFTNVNNEPVNEIFEDPFEDRLEPIVVIGMAMRGPQDATSPEALWKMIREGRSAMTEIPSNRFNPDAFCETENPRIGSLNVRGGHFMKEDLAAFDAPFFSISSAEAALMDPQQRWLLETSYEALENAGIPIRRATGTRTSVHIGSFTREFEIMLLRDPEMRAKYRATGTGMTMLANRLSWYYDFSGPSLAVDTACSSSLTTVHLACQSLRSGEVDMGIAGGCNVILNPDTMTALTDMSFLSPDNKCHSFDASANGYSRGEGFGLVVLKRLKDALRDHDTIRGVIRATGINQDGRTPSITQPSSVAQETLIKDTYEAGGLSLGLTRFFEAHGTGTPVGDPLEAQAIYRSFQEPLKDHSIYIGAVKSNTGHLEGASGVTGLIKTILSLEEGVIPPNLWLEEINPRIQAKAWNLEFPTSNIPWPAPGLRRASINSFGYGGSNAHCVIDDAYNYLRLRGLDGNHATNPRPPNQNQLLLADCDQVIRNRPETTLNDRPTCPSLLVWSAPDEAGLNRLTATYTDALTRKASLLRGSEESLAYTLSERRSSFAWKSFLVSNGFDTFSHSTPAMVSKPVRSLKDPSLCYVFTGQGAQWAKMGVELEAYKVYAKSLHAADVYFQSLGSSWSLKAEIGQESNLSCLDGANLSQPACTALQIALVDLLMDWGIRPSVVIGHSSGEIAAAYCAGAISRESAWKIAYFRGLVASLPSKSFKQQQGMMAVGLPELEAIQFVQEYCSESSYLTVACVNSPQSVTLSGDGSVLDDLRSEFNAKGIFARKLHVNVAYHSDYMLSAAETYTSLLGEIAAAQPLGLARPVMISSVTGEKIETNELRNASYWVQNMVSKVRFSDAVAVVCSSSSKHSNRKLQRITSTTAVDRFVEIGPHSALRGALHETHEKFSTQGRFRYSSILNRGEPSNFSALRAAGELYSMGASISVSKVNQKGPSTKVKALVNLPQYPFDHSKRYWQESRISKAFRFRTQPHDQLLGSPAMDWNPLQACWRNHLSVSEIPWLVDHKVQGSVVYPAAGVIAMAMKAARQLLSSGRSISAYRFKDVMLSKALVIPPDSATVESQMYLVPVQGDATDNIVWGKFTLFAFEDSQPVEISSGNVGLEFEHVSQDSWDGLPIERYSQSIHNRVKAGSRRCTTPGSPDIFYKSLDHTGITYGPSFQCIKDLSIGVVDRTASAVIDLFNWRSRTTATAWDNNIIHPIALDTVFQLVSAAATEGGTKPGPPMVPTRIRDLWISTTIRANADHPNATALASVDHQGLRSTELSLAAIDTDNGIPIITGALQTSFLSSSPEESGSQSLTESRRFCYKIEWKPEVEFLSEHAFRSAVGRCETRVSDFGADLEAIERLCGIICTRTRDRLVNSEVLATKPHLAKYLLWAERAAASYEDTTGIRHTHDQTEIDKLIDDVEIRGSVGKLTARVARALPDILNGTVDALELLFQDSLIQDFYSYANNAAELFAETARYVDLLAHRNPALRILEIGAGTGSATASALSVVSQDEAAGRFVTRFTEWNYTDVSSGFFELAREKFRDQAGQMKFTVLDIEKDPIEQGFQPNHYDLIIASNVVHATQDLNRTLKNTRKLLKPDGTFLLYEMTKPDRLASSFIFGLLPGWWAASEETRKWSPLITENEWHEQLLAAGFSGIHHSLPNCDNEDAHTTTAMISKAASNVHIPTVDTTAMIVVRADSELQLEIAKELETKLNAVGIASTEIVTLTEFSKTFGNDMKVIFLADLEDSFLLTMNEVEFNALQHMVSHCDIIVWPTCGRFSEHTNSASSMVDGLLRGIRLEHDQLTAILVAVDCKSARKSRIENITQIFLNAVDKASRQTEVEYEERDGVIGTRRLIEHHAVNNMVTKMHSPQPQLDTFGDGTSRPLKLATGVTGLLNTLHFQDDQVALSAVGRDEIEIKVMCSGLNFRDVLIALGQLNGSCFGSECSGIVVQSGSDARFRPGDRVVCMASGSIGSYARCNSFTAAAIPPSVSFRAAAALPIIFCTAYYALVDIANLKEKESVLIHSAAGGLGQALVQLALMLGADIYATVGNQTKRDFLVEKYGLRPDHIFSSRSSAFVQGIHLATDGRGIDVIVNSLSGERLKNSWECTAPFGRFVEVGKRDVESFQSLPMSRFSLNTSFSSVDLLFVKEHKPTLAGKLLETVLSLFTQGKIWLPSDFRVYNATSVEEAFRFMQSGKATGKAVFEFLPADKAQIVPRIGPSHAFDSQATYIIAGGLGGLGRSATKWMVDRGARHLILLSRSKPGTYSPVTEAFLTDLKANGVKVCTPPCDIADLRMLQDCLAVCASTMPPIKGCIQASMVLRDGRFSKLTLSDFQAAVKPKVQGSWNLHSVLPSNLDFFILLSSGVGLLGNYGQSNYASGGTYQDSLAHYRISQGQKAVSLDLGVISAVGYVAEQLKPAGSSDMVTDSTGVTEAQFLAILDHYCDPSLPILDYEEAQVAVGLDTPAELRARGNDDPFWLRKPIASYLHRIEQKTDSADPTTATMVNNVASLSTVQSLMEASDIVCEALTAKLSRFVDIKAENIEIAKPLHAYGIDSLSAVELRKWFARVLKADVTVFEILGNTTIESLSRTVAEKSALVSAKS